MARADIMLAMVMQQLADLEQDCGKFVDKENLAAGLRARKGLRLVKAQVDFMIKDMAKTSNEIKKKRGRTDYIRYRGRNVKKHNIKAFSESQINTP